MIFLNLLPEKYKIIVKAERVNLSLRNDLIILLVILSFSTATLMLARFYLLKKLQSLNINQPNIANNQKGFNKEIVEINRRIEALNNLQKNFKILSDPLLDITGAVGGNIYLKSLSVDSVNRKVTLKGFAKTRDGLLEFRKDIEELKNIADAEIPLSQLLENENLEFTLEAKINL